MRQVALSAALPVALACAPNGVAAELSQAELAKQLGNPIAALISVPLRLNYDRDIGAGNQGDR